MGALGWVLVIVLIFCSALGGRNAITIGVAVGSMESGVAVAGMTAIS